MKKKRRAKKPKARSWVAWAGFVEDSLHYWSDDGAFRPQPQLFRFQGDAKKVYEDVRRVRITEERPWPT